MTRVPPAALLVFVAGVGLALSLVSCTSNSSPGPAQQSVSTGPNAPLNAADALPFAEGAEADLAGALAADPVDFHQQTRACIQLAELDRRLDPAGLPSDLVESVAAANRHCPGEPDQALADIRQALSLWPVG